ncbi:MAG: glycosyltransferase family 2 protein [Conexivisphaerales archaeon]
MSELADESQPAESELTSSPEKLQQLEKQIVEPSVEETPAPAPKEVVLCVPALNNEKQIGKLVSRALKSVNKVIVCDDGSMDQTAARAREAGAFVILHGEGLGKGKAISDLMEEALKSHPQVVVTMEVEKHNDPDQIPELIEPLLRDEADICIGVHEESGVPVRGADLLALNSKALAARSRDDFFTSIGGGDQLALAVASGLRLRIVTFKTVAAPPAAVPKTAEGLTFRARWDRTLHSVIVERPFFYVGAPGIEMTVAGVALIIIALISYKSGSRLNVPLLVVGGVALLFGLVFIMSFSVLYAVLHSSKGKAGPPK